MHKSNIMKQLIISLLAFSAIVSTSFAQDYSKEDEEAIALAIEYSDNGKQ